MDGRLGLVEVGDELADAAVVVQDVLGRLVLALVAQGNADARVQKGRLAQALEQDVVVIPGGLENLRVGLEADRRAALGRAGDGMDFFDRLSARKAHDVLVLAVAHLGDQPER